MQTIAGARPVRFSARNGDTRDPLFNQSVEKALVILEVFGGERRAMNLAEISLAVGMTKSSAQRCTHTLERLGYLRRDSDIGGFLFWVGQINSGQLRDATKQHAMVCAFTTALEYQQRFSFVVTHSNAECR